MRKWMLVSGRAMSRHRLFWRLTKAADSYIETNGNDMTEKNKKILTNAKTQRTINRPGKKQNSVHQVFPERERSIEETKSGTYKNLRSACRSSKLLQENAEVIDLSFRSFPRPNDVDLQPCPSAGALWLHGGHGNRFQRGCGSRCDGADHEYRNRPVA